jgi:fatty acid desaturase
VQTATADSQAPPGDFRFLAAQVRSAGLLDRRRGYYWAKIILTVGAFAAGWAAFFVLGASWANLGVAAFLGVMSTQLGFLGHDAGHGQIFTTRRANRLVGLGVGNALVGLSYGWWVPKHSAHHAHPNQLGRDPDIGVGLVGPPDTDSETGQYRGFAGWMARHQAGLFFPLMVLRSAGLYYMGIQDLVRRRDRAGVAEPLLLAVHAAFYLTAVFWVLPLPMAVAFIAVHQAVFSFYLGCSFAPNHKGMPTLDGDTDMGFAQRQIVTARNVSGGLTTGFVFGGLNYQIEHHLFPTMPRPNLARAQELVRSFCAASDFGYFEDSPMGACRHILSQLSLAASVVPPAFD